MGVPNDDDDDDARVLELGLDICSAFSASAADELC
jgi:hypothetical protein